MAFEFDNEMDFLLRQAARENNFASEILAKEHLDPDDLTAFAENALPERARLSFVSHLANCNSCRKTLSNLILLNESAQDEAAKESNKEIGAAKQSWLDSIKKLFAVPTLGLATAALAVLLIGSFAFVALRGTQESRQNTVAYIEPEQTDETRSKKRAAAPAPAARDDESDLKPQEIPVETPSPNTEMPADSASVVVETPANEPPGYAATRGLNRNSAAAVNAAARNEVAAADKSINQNSAASDGAPRQTQPNSVIAEATTNKKTSESEIAPAASPAPKPEDRARADLLARSSNDNKDGQAKTEDESDLAKTTAAPALAPATERRAATAATARAAEKKVLVETRTVGSKTFQKIGGVWKDTAYNSQNATAISRGSDEYKKLDARLRSIAEQLGGEVFIVWQGKAYRIR